MSKEMQKVILHLDPIEVIVEKTNSKEKLIENAKKAALEQLKTKFPRLQYSLVDLNTLSMDDIKPGMVVEANNEVGIVTTINKKTVNVVFSGNRVLSGPAEAFKSSKKSFKEAMVPRRVMKGMEDFYSEGNCGYIPSGGKDVPVVIGKETRGKYKLWSLEQPGSSYSVTNEQLVKLFKDVK